MTIQERKNSILIDLKENEFIKIEINKTLYIIKNNNGKIVLEEIEN